MKSGLRRVDGRWYVVVSIWDNEDASGPPVQEYVGPNGGFATENEALASHHEKVRPITAKMIAEAEADGVEVETILKPTLH